MRVDEGGSRRLAPAEEPSPAEFQGWQASLALSFAQRPFGTQLASARHQGPLRVQRPFYPEGKAGPCHVYVLHPPGGIVSGDRLALEASLEEGTSALLTAPGASKLYRARLPEHAPEATVAQRFVLGPRSLLEWLPHETIVYDGARASLRTEIELAGDATYAGWELLCLGRPASGERFGTGALRTELSVRRAGRLLYLERGLYRGGDVLLDAPWGLAGEPVLATLLVASPHAETSWIEAVRAEVTTESGRLAATLVSGMVVVRYLGSSTLTARALLERAHAVLRPLYAERRAVRPRIWST